MTIQLAPTPASLYRIGRAPDPLAFPPLEFCGSGRYDDPTRRTSVLYGAMDRRAVFMETLDAFRPDLISLSERDARLRADLDSPLSPPRARIPSRFFKREIVRFSVGINDRWLDVRSTETHAALREELARPMAELGFGPRFVLGDLLSNSHRLTQLIAGWAIDRDFQGIAYASCHDPSLTCWAVFEGAEILRIEDPRALQQDDPDLVAVARLWKLDLPRP